MFCAAEAPGSAHSRPQRQMWASLPRNGPPPRALWVYPWWVDAAQLPAASTCGEARGEQAPAPAQLCDNTHASVRLEARATDSCAAHNPLCLPVSARRTCSRSFPEVCGHEHIWAFLHRCRHPSVVLAQVLRVDIRSRLARRRLRSELRCAVVRHIPAPNGKVSLSNDCKLSSKIKRLLRGEGTLFSSPALRRSRAGCSSASLLLEKQSYSARCSALGVSDDPIAQCVCKSSRYRGDAALEGTPPARGSSIRPATLDRLRLERHIRREKNVPLETVLTRELLIRSGD